MTDKKIHRKSGKVEVTISEYRSQLFELIVMTNGRQSSGFPVNDEALRLIRDCINEYFGDL